MKTVADPEVLRALIARLNRLDVGSRRRWGTLTPHEMLCHLGDATDMVLLVRPRIGPSPIRRRMVFKLLFLWSPIRWPDGVQTNPRHNPRVDGTRPSDFSKDLERVIRGLQQLATGTGQLEPAHGLFGTMSRRDWQRWAYRHTDHHLCQFGL